MSVTIRPFRPGDAPELFSIFHAAVRTGAAARYTEAQRRAWLPVDEMPDDWEARVTDEDTWVAESAGSAIGFMGATRDGYLDLAFVRPEWMGKGVSQPLHDRIVGGARDRKVGRMTTHASHFARSFFARNGWQVDHPETVERGGERLERFAMSLMLEADR